MKISLLSNESPDAFTWLGVLEIPRKRTTGSSQSSAAAGLENAANSPSNVRLKVTIFLKEAVMGFVQGCGAIQPPGFGVGVSRCSPSEPWGLIDPAWAAAAPGTSSEPLREQRPLPPARCFASA